MNNPLHLPVPNLLEATAKAVTRAVLLGSAALLLGSSGPSAQTFEAPSVFPTDVWIWGGMEDMDGDGDVDLVLIHESLCPFSCPPRVHVWPNNGAGDFGAPAVWNANGFSPYKNVLALGDFDGDGWNDVAYSHGTEIRFHTSNGDGTFSYHGSMSSPSGLPPRWMRAADVEGDGDTDLLFSDRSLAANLVVARNDGSGTFVQEVNAVNSGGSSFADVGDVDSDGDLDFVSASHGEFAVRTNDGAGAYGAHGTYAVNMWPPSPHLTELNGDGLLDLAVAGTSATGGTPYTEVWSNSGAGVFAFFSEVGADLPSSQWAGVADYDRDGDGDLLIGRTSTAELALWINDGSAGFVLEGTYSAGVNPGIFGSADLDGDGHVDVMVHGWTDLACLRNTGNTGAVLAVDPSAVSLATGGAQSMTLNAGANHGAELYIVLGSISGTAPGVSFDGVSVPLNPDPHFLYLVSAPNTAIQGSLGWLGAGGESSAVLSVPSGLNPALAGQVLHHAYLTLDSTVGAVTSASNAASLLLLP